MGDLAGKVVLISGAAAGLGASHARAVVAAGGSVIIGDLNEAGGRALVEELGQASRFVRLDVTSSESWDAAISFAEEEFGSLNVLVNNAGVLRTSPIAECDDAEWDLVIATNLTGAFKGIRAAASVLAKYAPASIVNISSTAGMKGFAGSPAYNTSKWGVRGLTKTAALELADSGIRVTSVHPGNVKTNMIDGLYEDGFPHVAQKRAADPVEISNMVVFLASDLSSFATGSEFVVDGGETAGLPALW